MTRLQTYGTISVFVLSGALFRGLQAHSSSSVEATRKSEVHGSAEKPAGGDGPWLASCRYWATVRKVPGPDPKPSPKLSINIDATGQQVSSDVSGSVSDSRTECAKAGDGWGIPDVKGKAVIKPEIHAVIAVVPDPIHSHLALEFDRTIDSLMQAAADHRYLASNYWLPWRPPTTAGSSESSADQSNESKSQEQPGLIVLKFSPPAPERNSGQTSYYSVIYLFLVGESPATGMNGPQLRNALKYESSLRNDYSAELTMADPSRIAAEAGLLLAPHFNPQERNDLAQLLPQLNISAQAVKDAANPLLFVRQRAESLRNPTLFAQVKNVINSFLVESEKFRKQVGEINSSITEAEFSFDSAKITSAVDGLITDPNVRAMKKDNLALVKKDVLTLKNDLNTVAFIGPRSSGAATSLRQALLCAPFANPPSAFVGAGTTSTKIAAAELEDPNPWGVDDLRCPASAVVAPAKDQPTQKQPEAKPEITYVSFGENTDYEVKALNSSFQSDQPDTAVLVEDDTVFGAASTDPFLPHDSRPGIEPLYIRFPREISLLRNAQTEQQGASPSQAPSPYLSLSLKDSSSDDMIPRFSTGQSPLSQEAQLMTIERQLQKTHIRHILITASNILDEIFLARELHRACPDATIVFYNGADGLLERDIDDAPYIGSLTVTPYSIVSLDRPSDLSRRAFSNSQAAAVYNAASYIFWWGSTDSLNLPRLTNAYTVLSQSEIQHFPLYVDAIGTDGYYPLGILSPCASDSDKITPDVNHRTTSVCNVPPDTTVLPLPELPTLPSLFWFLLCDLVIVLCCGHGFVILSANYWSPFTRDLAIAYNDQPRRRAVYVHIGAAMLFCAALVLTIPFFAFAASYHRSNSFALWTSIGVLVTAIFAAVATLIRTSGYRSLLKTTDPRHPTELYRFFNILAAAFIIVAAASMLRSCFHNEAAWGRSNVGLFFSYRCLHPGSGISPVIPLLLLIFAWYLWAVFQTFRLRFSEMNRPRLPHRKSLDVASRVYFVSDEQLSDCSPPISSCLIENIDCFLITRELARRITRLSPIVLNIGLGLAYLSLFILCAFRLHIYSFERFLLPGSAQLHGLKVSSLFHLTSFEWVVAILFFPLVMIALSGWIRVLFIWSSLQYGLLEPLERSPLRFAFNRLSEVNWVAMLSQSGLNIRWRDMTRSLESLRQLSHNNELNEAVSDGARAELQAQYKKLNILTQHLREHIGLESQNPDPPSEEKTSVLKEITAYRNLQKNPDLPDANTVADLCYIHGIELGYAEMSTLLLNCLLIPHWEKKRTGYIDSIVSNDAHSEKSRIPEPEDPAHINLAEEFIAIRYVSLIRMVLVNIRHLMLFVSLAFVFGIVAWNSYPFQPHQQLDWCFTILMLVLTAGFVYIFAQMHRNAILSRITSTTPNELGADFYIRILTFGAVPVLTWLAYQFPTIGGTIFRIFQPSLQVK
jgi:hypothetical protein